jgi:hypothetical protein
LTESGGKPPHREPPDFKAPAVRPGLLFRTISKLPEQDKQASELDETEKVLRVDLPADQQASSPLNPGEEAFHQPAKQSGTKRTS